VAHFLVTGGAGFVGSHLVDALLRAGHRVRVLDDLSSGSRSNLSTRAELVEADIVDSDAVAGAIADVDGCYHLAAIASVERSNREWLRTHQVNLTGTINVFEAARRRSGWRPIPIVYASTAAVYGDCGPFRVREDRALAPQSAYGADKAACEFHARIAGAVHAVPTIGLRFFNLYGPRQNPCSPYSGVVSKFVDRLLRGEPVEIFGDGGQVRDFTYIDDAVAALCRAMPAADTAAPVFNVCTGVPTSVRRLAETIARLCAAPLVTRYSPPRQGELRVSIGDPSQAAAELDFAARISLADGLAMMLDAAGGWVEHRMQAV
jgi:UDP-glucose 4-epimerase